MIFLLISGKRNQVEDMHCGCIPRINEFGQGTRVNEMLTSMNKPVFGVSDHVRHKPGCTATEDGFRLEISDLGSRGIVLSVWRKQRRRSAAQLLRS